MTPFAHAAGTLALFQARLAADLAVDPASFTLACGAPTPYAPDPALPCCQRWSEQYNSQVDLQATGGLVGEVVAYPYNRLDIATLALPEATYFPYLRGSAATVLDLLPEFLRRSGLALTADQVIDQPLPTNGSCGCSPEGFDLLIAPTSLLFIGRLTLYLVEQPVPLPTAIRQPILAAPTLPSLSP